MMRKTVTIDCFPENVIHYRSGYAVVAVDVVRATTSAVTAAALGRRCFPVPSLEAAHRLAARLDDPLLAGEQRGLLPPGFHINNSPARIAARTDIQRPLVLLSSSGTRLCHEAAHCDAAYVACLRNYAATARHLAASYPAVALIGAGNYDEFREEDQLCCAWLAQSLIDLGYLPADDDTLNLVRRWSRQPADSWLSSRSAAYLRNSAQLEDLEFILDHVGDLEAAFALINGEVIAQPLPVLPQEKSQRGAYGA